MIINNRQIMQLIAIAHSHAFNLYIKKQEDGFKYVQNLLKEINNQQSEELKEIKE
jgi:hypothetical protein